MRALRDTTPGTIHKISIRTEGETFFLHPDEELNDIVGGIIARYQSIFNIKIYAVCVLSDHYHILAQATSPNLWRFAGNVNREIAKRVNRFRGRKGHFWGRRYDDLVTIEEVDALHGYCYILNNPTHHGLVEHPKFWPGLSSYPQACGAEDKTYSFVHWTEVSRACKKSKEYFFIKKRCCTKYALKISPLPQFKDLPAAVRIQRQVQVVEENRKGIILKRQAEGKFSFLGRKKILKKLPSDTARRACRKARPWFYTQNMDARKRAMEIEKDRRMQYKIASTQFRNGDYSAVFPGNSLLPPMHYSSNSLKSPLNYSP